MTVLRLIARPRTLTEQPALRLKVSDHILSLDEIFAELELPDPDYGPDSIHLAPGEKVSDRVPHYFAKGRAKEAARRRAEFKAI